MKENKILIVCAVAAIVICSFFGLFFERAITGGATDVFNISESEYSRVTNEFSECGSRFESRNWAHDSNGQSTAHYYATNTITCKCADGSDRMQEYQYFSEPNDSELDCNVKCVEICGEE